MFWNYRGDPRMWAWLAHRVTGIMIFLFLLVHVVDTALIGWGRDAYDTVIGLYHHPLFRIGEIFLVAIVLFHGINGLSVILLELAPSLALRHKSVLAGTLAVYGALTLPVVAVMVGQIFQSLHLTSFHWQSLKGARPWLMALVPTLAVLLLAPPATTASPSLYPRPTEKGLEFYGWLFMRFSGVALIFLALGHLWIMHLMDGGVSRINYDFVAQRFLTPLWRTYDLLLLGLAMGHGVWGMRTVVMDYIHRPIRRLLALWTLYGVSAIVLSLGALILFTFEPQVGPS